MSSSSFLTELFNADHWPMMFFHPVSGEDRWLAPTLDSSAILHIQHVFFSQIVTEVQVTSLLRSPGLFSVLLPISTILWSVRFWFFHWFLIPPISFSILKGLSRVHQLSSSTFLIFQLLRKIQLFVYLFGFFYFHLMGSVRQWSGRPGFSPRLSHAKDF